MTPPDATSKCRRRAGADDLARLGAGVVKPVRHGAQEVIRIASFQYPCLPPDGQLDLAADDDATFLALVTQHVIAGIGAWAIALVHDRHRAIRPFRCNQTQGHFAVTQVRQLTTRVEDLDRKSTRLNSSHLVISYA